MTFDFNLNDKPEENCKGLIFRGKVNSYLGSKGECVYQKKMIPLKRLSCPGCKKCIWLKDDLCEWAFDEHHKLIIKDIEDGALYQLLVTNVSRDWESGIVDDWDLEFVKIKNETS